MQVLHLEPLARPRVLYVRLVGALLGGALVHDVGHQVVGPSVRVLVLELGGEEVAELDRADGEVDDGRVLLSVEAVLGEALDAQDDVRGEPDHKNKTVRSFKYKEK